MIPPRHRQSIRAIPRGSPVLSPAKFHFHSTLVRARKIPLSLILSGKRETLGLYPSQSQYLATITTVMRTQKVPDTQPSGLLGIATLANQRGYQCPKPPRHHLHTRNFLHHKCSAAAAASRAGEAKLQNRRRKSRSVCGRRVRNCTGLYKGDSDSTILPRLEMGILLLPRLPHQFSQSQEPSPSRCEPVVTTTTTLARAAENGLHSILSHYPHSLNRLQVLVQGLQLRYLQVCRGHPEDLHGFPLKRGPVPTHSTL